MSQLDQAQGVPVNTISSPKMACDCGDLAWEISMEKAKKSYIYMTCLFFNYNNVITVVI